MNGYKNGEIGNGRKKECHNGIAKLSLDQIASELNMSKRNLQRALSIERNLTEPMKKLLDDGIISKTVAADLISSKLFSILNDTLERGRWENVVKLEVQQKKLEKELKNWKDCME